MSNDFIGPTQNTPKFGHSEKIWKDVNKGRRTVTCFVSEEEYRELEDIRDEMNKNVLSVGDEKDFVSVSGLVYSAIQFYIDDMKKGD